MSDAQQSAAAPPYKTANLALAAYLHLYGLTPRVVAQTASHGVFLFDPSPELDRRIGDYLAGKAIASLSQYEACRTNLRNALRVALEGAQNGGAA